MNSFGFDGTGTAGFPPATTNRPVRFSTGVAGLSGCTRARTCCGVATGVGVGVV